MGSRGSMMISLIAGVFFLVILTVGSLILLPRYTQIGVNPLNNPEETKSITAPIDTATFVATQANLNSIQVGLGAYFAEMGIYPNSLQEISSAGYLNPNINLSNYTYQVCGSSGTKVILYSTNNSNQGMVINQGVVQNTQSKPSCI